MTDSLRGVKAESRDSDRSYYKQILGTGWYTMYVMTQSDGNEATASIGRRE